MAKKIIDDDVITLQAQGQLYISEIEAKVPWSLGVNAKNCLRRDAFLINFLPRFTSELLARHGWTTQGQMERAIANDTKLLAQLTEEAVKDMDERAGWTDAISDAHSVMQDTKDLITLIEIFHKYKYADQDLTEKQLNRHLTDYRNSMAFIQKQVGTINKAREKYEKANESLEKMHALTDLRNEEQKLYSAQAALSKAKFTLAANNRFDFNKDANVNTIEAYVAQLVEGRKKKIEELKKKFMDKYNAIPQYLNVYETLVNDLMEQMFLTSEPNLDKYKLMIEKDVEQYISILEDGPNVILQCARIYPKLQQNLENEILFEKSDGGRMNTALDPDDEFKALHDMPWPFTGMIGKDYETVLDAPSDKIILSLVGPPGIGKTAMIESIAKQMGFLFKSISIPHCDSSMFGGLATITNQDQVKQLASQDMADAITSYGIVDLEEATAAPDNSVHLQMARFLQTGAIGINKQIHPLTVFVMTSNDNIMDNADIKPFSTVIMNRIDTLAMKNPQKLLNKWCSWVLHNPAIQGDPDAAETYNYIITFLKYDPQGRYYDGVSPESIQLRSTQEGLANPSFRSWKAFADKIQMVVARKDLSVEERANQIRKNGVGIIGPAATEKFVEHFVVSAKVPSIEELINRMDSAKPKWRIVDAIRIFDMGGNLKDNNSSGNRLQKKAQETDEPALEEDLSAPGRSRKNRYSIGLKKEDNDQMVAAVNNNFLDEWEGQPNIAAAAQRKWRMNNPGKSYNANEDSLEKEYTEILNEIESGTSKLRPPRHIEADNLTPVKTLESNYNKIWGSDEIDITNSAVLFNLSGQITSRVERLYEEAYYNNKPLDGEKLQKLFMLAMTIPAKDFRTALVSDLCYKIFSNDKYEIYYKNGVAQKESGTGKDIVLKLVPNSYCARGTRELVKINKEEAKERIREEGAIPADKILGLIPIPRLLDALSNGFKMRDSEEKAYLRKNDNVERKNVTDGPSL